MKNDPTLWGNPKIILSAPKSLNISSINAGLDFSLTMDDFSLKLELDSGQTNRSVDCISCTCHAYQQPTIDRLPTNSSFWATTHPRGKGVNYG